METSFQQPASDRDSEPASHGDSEHSARGSATEAPGVPVARGTKLLVTVA